MEFTSATARPRGTFDVPTVSWQALVALALTLAGSAALTTLMMPFAPSSAALRARKRSPGVLWRAAGRRRQAWLAARASELASSAVSSGPSSVQRSSCVCGVRKRAITGFNSSLT